MPVEGRVRMKHRRAVMVVLAWAALFTGCGMHGSAPSGTPSPRVTGAITYPQPVALPAGSIAHVALVEVRGRASDSLVLSEQTFPVAGRPPLPFVLPYPAEAVDPSRHYALRARITDAGGRVFWATPRPVPVLTQGYPAEADIPVSPAVGSHQTAPPATFFFECTGLTFTARHDPGGIFLFLPGETAWLPEAPAASGAKYSDGRTTFWSKGEEALVEHDGRTYRDCRNDRRRAVWEDAKLNGVDFRAVGNEPGWYLHVYDKGSPERIDFVTDYGRDYYTFPNVRRETRQTPPHTRYLAQIGAHRLEVTLEPGGCRDSMSGEPFETRVSVKLGNRAYTGCGRALH
jgi:putative lipoprotein